MMGSSPDPAHAAQPNPARALPGGVQTQVAPSVPDHELLCRIGRGGYGEVWLARNVLGTHRAVKVVYRNEFETDRPFEREFTGIQRFEPISRTHESQVNILHVGRTVQYFYCVMELADDQIRGQSIEPGSYSPKTVRSEIQSRGKLPLEECIAIALNLTTALQHLHSHSLVHRDIKPSNIIFINGRPKLADIGLVTDFDGTHSYVGTQGYIAPEGPGSPQGDIYSLGKVLYEISTGKDRQDFPEPPTLPEGSAEERAFIEFQEILLKACEWDPKRRYQTADHLRAELEILRAGQSVRRLRTLERRQALLMPLGLGAVLLSVLGSAAYLFTVHETREAVWQARRADQEAARARNAEHEARDLLWDSYVAQARAWRRTSVAGRRFESLGALKKAAQIRPSIEVRNEAIASLALADIGNVTWKEAPAGIRLWAMDPKFERYARADNRGLISVRRVTDDHELLVLRGQGTPATSALTFSPDGRFLGLFYGTDELDLCVWDIERKAVQLKTSGIKGRCFEFSNDNRFIVLAQRDGPLLVYDLSSGGCTRSLPQGPLAYNLRLSPDARQLAVSSTESPVVEIREFETGRVLHSLLHSNIVRAIAWNPAGTLLATGCEDRNVYLWDLTHKTLRALLSGHERPVVTVSFNHRGDALVSSAWDSTTRLWDPLSSRLLVTKFALSESVFSQDDRWLTDHSFDNRKLGICEIAYSRECRLLRLDPNLTDRVTSCDFTADGRCLISSQRDGLRVSEIQSGLELCCIPEREVTSARFFAPDCLLTSGASGLKKWRVGPSEDGRGWRVGTATGFFTSPSAQGNMGVTEDGGTVSVSAAGQVFIFNAQNAKILRRFGDDDSSYFNSAISPDGRWAAATSTGQDLVRVWDLHSGDIIRDLPCLGVNHLAFTMDSRQLIVGANDEYQSWRTQPWEFAYRVPRLDAGGLFGSIACSRDGKLTALTYSARAVRLIDTATGQERATFEMPEPQVILSMAFSPDGSQLAVTGESPNIYIWDLGLIRQELASLCLDW